MIDRAATQAYDGVDDRAEEVNAIKLLRARGYEVRKHVPAGAEITLQVKVLSGPDLDGEYNVEFSDMSERYLPAEVVELAVNQV